MQNQPAENSAFLNRLPIPRFISNIAIHFFPPRLLAVVVVAMCYPTENPLLNTCEAAARAGGKELQSWQGRFKFREKGVADLVTDADLASQGAIQSVISAHFPDHAFVGEEQSERSSSLRPEVLTWIVDPLDGTTNYVHGYPQYAVSVAVAKGNEVLAGVIYDPVREECFAAAIGEGAWCNRERLNRSNVVDPGAALVAVSLPARVGRDSPDLLDFIEAVQKCQAVRRSGSAALNLAHVAAGTLDAFWATHIHAWDVAAGVLLIREAGGVVTARDGGKFDLWNPHFLVAATRELHGNLLRLLNPYFRPA
jgi:myo-inositol-1(or 4)-monophosphatase